MSRLIGEYTRDRNIQLSIKDRLLRAEISYSMLLTTKAKKNSKGQKLKTRKDD